MPVLYRKYRPQAFSEVIGQTHVVTTLKNQVKTGQVSHAYLFTGSRGVGKTSLARILAKAVNCLNLKEDGDSCGKCAVCKAVEEGNFIDLVEIDAASNTGVDNIRDLIEHVKFSPSLGKFKVFIIDEVHMLSKGAFNALLKTLEEPPKHAIFILATTEINKVPATIISRTQRFDFLRFSTAEIIQMLSQVVEKEGLKTDESILKLVAQSAEGGGRDALSLLDKVLSLGQGATLEECGQILGVTDFQTAYSLLELISRGSLEPIPEFFEKLLEKGADSAAFNRDFLEFLRSILIYKITGKPEGVVLENQEQIKTLSQNLSVSDLIFTIRLFLKSYKDLSQSPSAEIPLLLAALEAAERKTQNKIQIQNALKSKPDEHNESVKKSPAISEKNTSTVPQTEEKKEESSQPRSEIALEEVRLWWPSFVSAVKKLNGPLGNVLRTASLEGAELGVITLGVKFSFHKQNIENQKNQQLIRQALFEITGKNLAIKGMVTSETELTAPKVGPTLAEALQVFGGELIE